MPPAARSLILAILIYGTPSLRGESATTVSDARPDENGIPVHEVRSPFQAGVTKIRVLTPDRLEAGKRYPVIYVLPVEALDERRYGDGLLEVKKKCLHNTAGAIFVAPTFSHLPWYADHPTVPTIRQESCLLKVVLPYVESHYPAIAEPHGRLLLGFSKSGWGAYSLLLRHPNQFGRAAAWDAPLMLDQPGKYGSGEIFGTAENFDKYQVTALLARHADAVRTGRRFVLLGYGNFRHDHRAAHELMQKLGIEHDYRDGPRRKHEWSSGWLPDAVELLLQLPTAAHEPRPGS